MEITMLIQKITITTTTIIILRNKIINNMGFPKIKILKGNNIIINNNTIITTRILLKIKQNIPY